MKIIAVDVGGTNIRVALIDLNGTVLSRTSCPIEKDNGEDVLEQIIHLVNPLFDNVEGIGIAVAGAVTSDGLVWAPNIPEWKDLPLERILREKFHVDVMVKDDRSSMIFGESRFGVAKGYKDVAYVIVGTGIAAGLIINGEIYGGSRGLAGSLGWLITDGKVSQDPVHGNFESKVAGLSLEKRFGMNGQILAEEASKGNIKALENLNKLGEEIGIGIVDLVTIVDPEIVVIGGGVSKSWQYIEKGIRHTLDEWGHPIFKGIKVVCSSLGDDAGILGIYGMIKERVGD
ncbi:MAG: ROK family protein [Thermotogae bacterium]|jgi:glucokinase|nr:ROK family protein [Thermotogota bacterium]MCL5032703.1 ROK family protein [Thermotogota bacterium]